MLLAMTFFWLPSDSGSVSAQMGQSKARKTVRINDGQPGRRNGVFHKKNAYGYKNYGQYRRTQVGNRRYRLVKRSFWNDGIRRTRLVRVYY